MGHQGALCWARGHCYVMRGCCSWAAASGASYKQGHKQQAQNVWDLTWLARHRKAQREGTPEADKPSGTGP